MSLNTCQTYLNMKYWVLFLLSIGLFGCDSKSKKEKEIENIAVHTEIVRFDQEFAMASVHDLQELKDTYPMFFPVQFADSIWEKRIADTIQQQLNKEVSLAFPDESLFENEIKSLFKHIKYYLPQFNSPTIYTTTSDVDYRNKVIFTDDYLVIAIDTYLGEEHPFYEGIQKYLRKNLRVSQLVPDVAAEYAKKIISLPKDRTLLSQMIYHGKILYLKQLWIPKGTDAEIIGYTEDEFKWAQENEDEMWRYFIEEELLFSTDPKLPPRFINPAPFSKFYLEIDNESPGMLGRYLGWQIVRSYMEHSSADIRDLATIEEHELFNKSKFKPRK